MNLQYVNNAMMPELAPRNIPLLKDEDGKESIYRRVVLGAIGYYNFNGEYYVRDGVEDLFLESSRLQRRVNSRRLYIENGHPVMKKGQSIIEYKNLLLKDDETRTCGHIRKVELAPPTEEQREIKGVVDETLIIWGEAAPAGDKAKVLEDSFNNKYEDTCFSVRSFSRPVLYEGRPAKVITEFLKWDKVNEPGLEVSSKLQTPTLEGLSDQISIWSEQDLHDIRHMIETESSDTVSLEARTEQIASLMQEFERSSQIREEVRKASSLLNSKVFS